MSKIKTGTTLTTAYQVEGDTTGALVIQTGASPTTAVTVDSSQNVGIGTSPSAWVSRYKTVQSGNQAALTADNTYNSTSLGTNWYEGSGGDTYIGTGRSLRYALQGNTGSHAWFNAASGSAGGAITFTQAMTLDSSGNLLVGTTSVGGQGGFTVAPNSTAGAFQISVDRASTASNSAPVLFKNGGTQVGYIQYNNTSTTYGTSSDYRLKENILPMTGALEKVAALKPCIYTWKEWGTLGQGFIAHELQAVVPDCVTGEKDAVDADGNPVYQGIDTSFLVATLTAAIQEQQALITTLTERLDALENK